MTSEQEDLLESIDRNARHGAEWAYQHGYSYAVDWFAAIRGLIQQIKYCDVFHEDKK